MYYFVEYLRAKAAMRIALILLGLVFLAAILLRVSVHGPNAADWAASLEHSPTAHVTTTHLSDGSTRVVVDDPQKHTHAVIVQRGSKLHMEIREPSTSGTPHDSVNIGNVSVNEDVHSGISHVTVDSHSGLDFDLGLLFLGSIVMGLIVSTMVAGPLAKENDGHLEIAWTKPISREAYALAAIAVDIGAIVCSQLLAIGVVLLATLLFIIPTFSYGPHVVWNIIVALLGPIAWYAFLTAASASLKRGPGLVIGLGWLFATIVPGLAAALSNAVRFNVIAALFYTIFHTLSYLDPMAYMSFHNSDSTIGTGIGLPITATAFALAALSIGYIALSVLQWRRVEA
jgi:hypothetical protein